jgi:hypothetical protein
VSQVRAAAGKLLVTSWLSLSENCSRVNIAAAAPNITSVVNADKQKDTLRFS